jgi:hypothetical protein
VDRIVVRPRVQTPLLVVVFAVWALLGVSYFTEGDVVRKPDWFGLALGCVLLISGVAGIWRAVRMGVVVGAEGLRIRSFDSRDRVISWPEIEAITCDQVGARAGLPLLAPVIQIKGQGSLVIRAFGSYSRAGADRRVAQLRDFKAAAQERDDHRVIQCNYTEGTGVAAHGARAYVVRGNPGNANDRFVILVRSRGGHWVEKWENAGRLTDFRVKTLPAEHPLYARDLMSPERAERELIGVDIRNTRRHEAGPR